SHCARCCGLFHYNSRDKRRFLWHHLGQNEKSFCTRSDTRCGRSVSEPLGFREDLGSLEHPAIAAPGISDPGYSCKDLEAITTNRVKRSHEKTTCKRNQNPNRNDIQNHIRLFNRAGHCCDEQLCPGQPQKWTVPRRKSKQGLRHAHDAKRQEHPCALR